MNLVLFIILSFLLLVLCILVFYVVPKEEGMLMGFRFPVKIETVQDITPVVPNNNVCNNLLQLKMSMQRQKSFTKEDLEKLETIEKYLLEYNCSEPSK